MSCQITDVEIVKVVFDRTVHRTLTVDYRFVDAKGDVHAFATATGDWTGEPLKQLGEFLFSLEATIRAKHFTEPKGDKTDDEGTSDREGSPDQF